MQGPIGRASNSEAQGSDDQELFRQGSPSFGPDSQDIQPGQRPREEESGPQEQPNALLCKTTHNFVQDQKRLIEAKFRHLAILEGKFAKFSAMAAGREKLPAQFSVVRELPGLAPHCSFSVGAKAGLEAMFKAHDLAFMKVLADDLENKVIPDFEADIEEALAKARRKIDSDSPAEELHIARRRFEEGLEQKREQRMKLLETKRASEESYKTAKKRKLNSYRPFPYYQQHQWGGDNYHWHQRRQDSWRGRPRGRGRGRGRSHYN